MDGIKPYTWQCTYINTLHLPEDGLINGSTPIEEWLDGKPDPSEHDKLTEDFFKYSKSSPYNPYLTHAEVQSYAKQLYPMILNQTQREAHHYGSIWKLIWMYDQLAMKLLADKESSCQQEQV